MLGLSVAAATIVLDQASKLWLLNVFGLGDRGRVPILPFADLILLWNPGISYSLFQQGGMVGRIVLLTIAAAAVLLMLLWMARETSAIGAAALGLLIGGAVGNGVDRLAHGAVVDFLLLHYGTFEWYVFNVADAAITVGVVLLVYAALRRDGSSAATHSDGR
jgi:signal peptidase II